MWVAPMISLFFVSVESTVITHSRSLICIDLIDDVCTVFCNSANTSLWLSLLKDDVENLMECGRASNAAILDRHWARLGAKGKPSVRSNVADAEPAQSREVDIKFTYDLTNSGTNPFPFSHEKQG